jgi:hypothetical protein
MDEIEELMQRETRKVAGTLGLEANKSLKLESSNVGYFFRVTMKVLRTVLCSVMSRMIYNECSHEFYNSLYFFQDEKLIRHNKSFEVLFSKKDGVAFRNSSLEELSGQYLKKMSRYEEEQKDIVSQVIEVASESIFTL